jgi:hypothetical protein
VLSVRKGVSCALAILLAVLAVRWNGYAEPVVSGEWESTISVEPPTSTWSTETDLSVEIIIGVWIAATGSVFEDNEWMKQDFSVEATFGSFDIESDLRFEPYKGRFRDWITEVEWEADALTFTLITKLTRTTDWMIIETERKWDMIEASTSFRLRAPTGSCALVFYDADADLTFDWCGFETDLEISFDDDGFDEVVAELSDLALTRMSWCTFDLEIARTIDKTDVKITPTAILESSWCEATLDLEFEGEFPNTPNLLPLAITEAVLSWEIGEWELEATAILDPDKWIAKTYWFELQADAAIDLGACGEVTLELTFLWTETDLGRSLFALAYESEDPFSVSIEGDFDLENGELDQLSLTLQSEW